jgi:hypothetical protein
MGIRTDASSMVDGMMMLLIFFGLVVVYSVSITDCLMLNASARSGSRSMIRRA